MMYPQKTLRELKEKLSEVPQVHQQLVLSISLLGQKLNNEKSKEYLFQGVLRRLVIIERCIYKIFELFPPEKTEFLTKEELTDLTINLHAFFINITGIFDNLAWVFVYEKNLLGNKKEGKLNRADVDLFKQKTQQHLSKEFCRYLDSDTLKSWHDDYSKNYRDALAHRIPLYVPPSIFSEEDSREYQALEKQIISMDIYSEEGLTEHETLYETLLEKQKKLGRPSLFFAHSIPEGGKPAYMHGQVISDFMTIEEIIKKFCQHFHD